MNMQRWRSTRARHVFTPEAIFALARVSFVLDYPREERQTARILSGIKMNSQRFESRTGISTSNFILVPTCTDVKNQTDVYRIAILSIFLVRALMGQKWQRHASTPKTGKIEFFVIVVAVVDKQGLGMEWAAINARKTKKTVPAVVIVNVEKLRVYKYLHDKDNINGHWHRYLKNVVATASLWARYCRNRGRHWLLNGRLLPSLRSKRFRRLSIFKPAERPTAVFARLPGKI